MGIYINGIFLRGSGKVLGRSDKTELQKIPYGFHQVAASSNKRNNVKRDEEVRKYRSFLGKSQ